MAKRSHQTTWQDVLIFWAKVLVICIVLGVISFYIGRNYLGSMIADTSIEESTPEIVAQIADDEPTAPGDSEEPPDEPKVEVHERDPSTAEVNRAREEYLLVRGRTGDETSNGEDGDGPAEQETGEDVADDGEETSSDESDATEEETPADSNDEAGSSDGREFVVIAGSFVTLENAESTVDELRDAGYEPYITQVVIGDTTYNRVNVAAYPSREKAGELASELRREGHEVTVGVR